MIVDRPRLLQPLPDPPRRGAALLLRSLGVASLLFLALAVVGVATAAQVLLSSAPPLGWEGVIVAIALSLGLGSLVVGTALGWGASHAYGRWREGDGRAARILGGVLAVLGATAWWPWLVQEHHAPLDLYLLVLRLAALVAGLALVWLARRSPAGAATSGA